MRRRFIDLAHNGGCSQKLDATRLRGLLEAPQWPDAGIATAGNRTLASSVDLILPMVDDPALFGRIVATHVLSDLYAVGATPLFALNVLGLPFGDDAFPPHYVDSCAREMLAAADRALESEGASCAGGHTLLFDVLFFGMAATGVVPEGQAIANDSAQPGDGLVLTKPLGTSVATKAWKIGEHAPEAFQDVLDGMLRSNKVASEAMRGLSRCACTDISGFGFFGHLHNMLAAGGIAATVAVDGVPIYPTARAALTPDSATRLLEPNLSLAERFVSNLATLDPATRMLLADAQVSGGLLVALPAAEVDGYLRALESKGERGWLVGAVAEGRPAAVTLA